MSPSSFRTFIAREMPTLLFECVRSLYDAHQSTTYTPSARYGTGHNGRNAQQQQTRCLVLLLQILVYIPKQK